MHTQLWYISYYISPSILHFLLVASEYFPYMHIDVQLTYNNGVEFYFKTAQTTISMPK